MGRVSGLRFGGLVLSAALVASLAECGSGLGQKVIDALPASDAGSASLALDSIAGGGWDHYLVVCPYETTSSVEERLGFSWADAPDLSARDDRQAIVLVGNGEVVDHAVLDRSAVDLCADTPWGLIARTTPIEVSWSAESAMWTGQPAGTGDRTSP